MSRIDLRTLALTLTLACAAGPTAAQEFRGTLTGLVSDASGLPLPGASVVVIRIGADTMHSLVTRDDGSYRAPFLVPGSYTLRAELAGFKTFLSDPVILAVGQTLVLPIVLEVGDVTESVVVRPPALEAANADRGYEIDNVRVTGLPLIARNPFMLATLAPGVTYNGANVFQRPFDNGAIADWSINGGVNRNNDFLLDGAPNNAVHAGNNIAYVPPADAVQAFKVVTTAYDAQYGRTGGGIINVSLKAGTNVTHGTAYEFARRSAWDAGSVLENARGGGNTGHFLDQYGFEVDGPVALGRLYDGRDRTFFMASYEGYREGTPNPAVLTFPDERQRRGDFSGLRDSSGNLIRIYDPATGRLVDGVWVRDPFPGNVIPPDRLDPVAARLLSYFPLPNVQPAGPQAWRNNFVHAPNLAHDDFHNAVFKVDHVIGSAQRMFARYAMNSRTERRVRNGITAGPAVDGQVPLTRANRAGVVDWLGMRGSSLLVNLRASVNWYVNDVRVQEAEGFDLSELGLPASLTPQLPNPMFPRVNIAEYAPLGRGSTTRLPTTVLAIQPNVAWTGGTHAIRAGVDGRWTRYDPVETGFASMRLDFDRGFTQRTFDRTDALSGNAVASLLLGAPALGFVDVNLVPAYRWTYLAPWLQDDWRLTPRLTLNLGLRWDYSGPVAERENRLNAGFDPVRGALRVVGVDAERAFRRDWNNLQPRVGAAFIVNDRTVVRGGFGTFYLNPTTVGTSHGFSIATPVVTSLDGNRTSTTPLADPFPQGITMPGGAGHGVPLLLGRSPTFSNPEFVVPYVQQFSAGIIRQLPWDVSVDAAYVGSRSFALSTTWRGFNEPSLAFRNMCDVTVEGDPAFCTARLPNPFLGMPGFEGTLHFTSPTLSRYDLARPYPQYAEFSEADRNDGRLWYNALQVAVTKRMSHGVAMSGAYTFSRTTEQTGFRDDIARTIDRSPAATDRPHRATLSAVYATPALRSGGLLASVISGWTIAGTFIRQSGRPWELPANVYYVRDAAMPLAVRGPYIQGVQRCVAQTGLGGSLILLPYSRAEGCTAANFIVRPPFTGRTTALRDRAIRLPAFRTVDVGIARTLPLAGRMRLQVRADVFNVLNEPMYDERSYVSDVFNSDFGRIDRSVVAQSNFPRYLQFAFKLLF